MSQVCQLTTEDKGAHNANADLRDIGNWRGLAEIPDVSFEESELYLEEGQNKDMFIQFVRKMVAWDPNERQTARQLLTDPWLAS